MSTQVAKKHELQKDWYVVDLEDKVLGRAATEIARVLRPGGQLLVADQGMVELYGTCNFKRILWIYGN